jgi:transcriptional regulator with XRE-family HTH domain
MRTDLQAAKRAQGITLAVLATEMDVTDSTVSRWLARESPIPAAKARKLARLLGIAVEDVLPPEDAK